ncbi:putative uncharacterized protein [Methylocaldum marinum]|uniref:YecA family protein n=1 Tax=Methylocaldum marinum TaxID=1432792 RepID=A0A250KZS2_9GAMM|nr:UPF0149 family protein [Methylocaldum marinum]BBA35279.1 putative uncharacterized protein [Methylocaldum marinum]
MYQDLAYQKVQDIMLNSDSVASAAEAHGVLSGLLCLNGQTDCDQWLEAVFGEARIHLDSTDHALLFALCETTRHQLDDFDFSFELLLPEDVRPLSERANALGEWCQGFLYGLGYRSDGADWPGDSTEVLHDILEISRLTPDSGGESDEVAYAEITEYVRVGVQLIRSELHQQPSSRLH